jgi:hypothetical protein
LGDVLGSGIGVLEMRYWMEGSVAVKAMLGGGGMVYRIQVDRAGGMVV